MTSPTPNPDDDIHPGNTARELALRYADHLVNTGGNDITRLLRGATNATVNLPLAMLEACVQSQAALLARLHRLGLLSANPPATNDLTLGVPTEAIQRAARAMHDALTAIGVDPDATGPSKWTNAEVLAYEALADFLGTQN
jgi:hypothetical protein